MTAVGLGPAALGAQLPGVTPPAPPGVARAAELRFSNDFLGRGGAIDDFRTQQLTGVARLSSEWTVVVDHSILTSSDAAWGLPARVDHLTVSGARRLWDRGSGRGHLELGAGLRYSGDAAGARIQNGFHQLVGSDLETMPYVGTDRVDGLLWLAAPFADDFRRKDGRSLLGRGWSLGYWVRSATLLSTDGEWDGSVGGSVTVSKGFFQGWAGVRGDWRRGHDRDPVTAATADFESGGAGVFGVRLGPVVLETAQGFDGEAAYGHLSFLARDVRLPGEVQRPSAVGIEAGFTLPDVTARIQARWWPGAEPGRTGWRPAAVLDGRFGRPQQGSDPERYVDTRQLSGALELESPSVSRAPWLTVYGAAGAGWRRERIEGFGGDGDGLRSTSASSVGLTGDLGVRVGLARADRLGFRLQTGLSGWLPARSRAVEFDGASERLLDASLGVTVGLLLQLRVGPER